MALMVFRIIETGAVARLLSSGLQRGKWPGGSAGTARIFTKMYGRKPRFIQPHRMFSAHRHRGFGVKPDRAGTSRTIFHKAVPSAF
jgi:hypothetical protein